MDRCLETGLALRHLHDLHLGGESGDDVESPLSPALAITTGVSRVTMKVRNGDGRPRRSRGASPTVS
jgi:hypothetical protein